MWKLFERKPICCCCGTNLNLSEERIKKEVGQPSSWYCDWCSVRLIGNDRYSVNTIESFSFNAALVSMCVTGIIIVLIAILVVR